jgi:uncharacterized protein
VSSIDQQFIEFVVKSLVGKPDAVQVTRRIDEKGVLLELTVDPEDLGRVIGKRGATAQSLRTLLRALGTKNDARYNLKIVDNGVADASGSYSAGSDAADDGAAAPAATVDESDLVDEDAEPKEEDRPAKKEESSERLRKAREELADLDDLDV